MSEDKMREARDAYLAAFDSDLRKLSARLSWDEGVKACAAIKDAEIAELKLEIGDWKLTADANFNSGEAVIKQQKAEIAARDLMIKELREALKWYISEDETFEGGEWEEINKYWLDGKRKAKMLLAEHHNSRALEKMLLEARIEEIQSCDSVAAVMRGLELKAKLAELNKE